jgi:hypothetical protein
MSPPHRKDLGTDHRRRGQCQCDMAGGVGVRPVDGPGGRSTEPVDLVKVQNVYARQVRPPSSTTG